MNKHQTPSKSKSEFCFKIVLPFVGILLVASTLRAPLTALGPVLTEIRSSLQLSNSEAGLLTTIPLMAFAFLSILVGQLSRKLNIEKFLLFSITLLIIGLYIRVLDSPFTLFLGSAILGIAICIGNVLVPGYIKKTFPNKSGMVIGFYSVSMNFTAALASGFSIAIGKLSGFGWKGSLGIWIAVAVISFLLWLPIVLKRSENIEKNEIVNSKLNIFKSSLAWQISLFMGLQSLMYYSIVTWLPMLLQGFGMAKEESGWVLSFMQLAMLPLTFLGPIIASKLSNQKILVFIVAVGMFASVVLILLFQLQYIYVAVILFGISSGLAFSLSMLFFIIRTGDSHTATRVSGMAQSVGYLLAAFGPPVFGKLYEYGNSWNLSLYFLLIMAVILLLVGLKTARNRVIS
ncbi:MFS transporter [Flavobacterium branchiarum]|uniref:CynX/NimT family MFS transporter n=1 Tax=Flavobacterium branchiarum TaxID=1114870 RepID=A0ABV5FQE2_9FLAO|nr:MFS transporter [Flavobacterium branchiarum]MDN3673229.1 MFS transporter [Flavobacterium branchiarum]